MKNSVLKSLYSQETESFLTWRISSLCHVHQNTLAQTRERRGDQRKEDKRRTGRRAFQDLGGCVLGLLDAKGDLEVGLGTRRSDLCRCLGAVCNHGHRGVIGPLQLDGLDEEINVFGQEAVDDVKH